MDNQPARLGDVIERLLASLGQAGRFHGWRIVHQWPEIVGPDIARCARAVRFADGVLVIAVEKDAWRQELEMQAEEILAKIRSRPGGRAVEKIIFKAG